ncbi:hypothetical protein [Nocardioides zeae]|uniref:ABC-type glycerol-3-phosphate transport system substrate-binding protein n=1 Tax=Nocardioides zeae TaxID=1457234 RepID=A0AAJ1X2B2_9ACTN|nr:hypothetical protein [Nocardioides zeae]MDQ1105711.1 ABC-type glycerol-3-phosphate transport system substrate-binding protein [Nocardioides zeae]
MSLAATGLAACGGGAEGNGNTGADCNPADVTVSGDGTATAPEECNFEGQTLTVAAYTGAMTEALQAGVGKLVEEATGATIEWVGVDNATAISQILASRGAAPPFDVVSAMTTVDQISLVDSQLLVEPSNLDEFADFPEQAFGAEGYQPGFYYFVTGMCVRSDKMAEAGLDATEGFDLLQEPALAGKVAFPNAGISQWDLLVPRDQRLPGLLRGRPERDDRLAERHRRAQVLGEQRRPGPVADRG